MNSANNNAAKKAYEVGYALFRVAAVLPSRAFAETLEAEALDLLRAAVGDLPAEAERSLNTLTYLVSFGRDAGRIHSDNAGLLLQQLESLGSVLSKQADDDAAPRADLSGIFSEDDPAPVYLGSAEEFESPADDEGNAANDNTAKSPANGKAAEERQGIILGRIREYGNVRTRDLQELLPDVSERTLRYDLQRLMEEGSIERIGSGGPASWYRPK